MQQQDKKTTHITLGLTPEMKAASFICGIKPYSSLGENAVIDEVRQQIAAVADGDMTRPAAMMAAHAETLDALFYSLVAKAQREADPEVSLTILSAALRAHEGCRSAVESLSGIQRAKLA
jgi:hypothetical protein